MKFVYNFYILIVLSVKVMVLVLSVPIIDYVELVHLSHKLKPIECLRLLKAMEMEKTMTNGLYSQLNTKVELDEDFIMGHFDKSLLSHENCLVQLEKWNMNLPENHRKRVRGFMETVLSILGRPDLAMYIKKNHRLLHNLNKMQKNTSRFRKNPAHSRSILSKPTTVAPSENRFKNPPKEAVLQVYRTPEEMESTGEKSIFENQDEIQDIQRSSNRDDDDSTNRWTGFLILLILISLIILSTVVFAIYKNNNERILLALEKSCDDRCRLTDRCSLSDNFVRKPFNFHDHFDQAASSTSSKYRNKRESVIHEKSHSSSSGCVRENVIPASKLYKNNLKEKQQNITKIEKRRRRRCSKKCSGLQEDTKRSPNVQKSIRTNQRKKFEMSEEFKNSATPVKTSCVEFKKLHDKIVNILKKDGHSCKCCKSSILSNECKCEHVKCPEKQNICMDKTCQKFELGSIPEKRKSSKELFTGTTTGAELKKKKDANCQEAKYNEKETAESSADFSSRLKNKRMFEIMEKQAKTKRETNNDTEACTRETCNFRRFIAEKN